ncbi:MAG: hypothetical protein BIFFINMI_01733 [Phycisphaerae bacterium]|nr:hypothetical protein [Phycisphaerae bacterium]
MPYEDFCFGPDDVYPRQRALFDQFEAYFKRKAREIYDGRDARWARDFSSVAAYERSVEPMRTKYMQMMGGWHWDRGPLELVREPIREFKAFTLERATYTLFEGVRTDGLLLVPRAPGPRAGLIVQVGVNGPPERICGFVAEQTIYKDIGARLAAHGYVVLATRMVTGFDPGRTRDLDHRAFHLMNETETEIRNYILEKYGKDESKKWSPQTKARNYIDRGFRYFGWRLFTTEMFALSRGVDLLRELAEADPQRVGMYGLSQGGMSAVHMPAMDTRVAAAVSSAYFNERYGKLIGGTQGYRPTLFYDEDASSFAKLTDFGDADIASLICPRPFGIEAGVGDDAVDRGAAEAEYARLAGFYERLGLADRFAVFRHGGGHEVEATDDVSDIQFVKFLDRWLANEPG